MKKVLVIITILVSILSISGCKQQFRIPQIAPHALYQTYDVNVSIGPDGAKHYFWIDCLDNDCDLIYVKTYSGSPVNYWVFSGMGLPGPEEPIFRYPDSAVTDDGTVYFVWHYVDDYGNYTDCCNHINADGTVEDPYCHPLWMPEFYTAPVFSHPRVIAFENVVYAVFERMENWGSYNKSLWYQQLSPLNASHGIVTNVGGGSSTDPSLAVSKYLDGVVTKYVLHVAWANSSGNASSRTVYNDNYGLTGDMTHQATSSEIGVRSNPSIAATSGSNPMVYITYRLGASGSSGMLRLMLCSLPDCSGMGYYIDGLLDSNDHFWLVGKPDISTVNGDMIMISFLGMNDDTRLTTTHQEIFTLTYDDSTTVPITPARLTTNDLMESDPRIAMTFPGVTIAWRISPASGLMQDVYIFDYSTNSIRKVFTSPAVVLDGFFDIAGRGVDVGGIFIDQISATDTQYMPWITMNVISRYLPVQKKP